VAVLSGLPWALLRLGRAGGGRAVGVLSVWLGWERLTDWWWKLRPLRSGGILRYRVVTYRGRPLTLDDSCTVHPGDLIVDLHLDNRRVVQTLRAGSTTPWDLIRLARDDLQTLAGLVASGELGEARAVRGVTLFARAGKRLGFVARPLPTTSYTRLQRYFLIGLVAVYHLRGWKAAERLRERRWPEEAWMSRACLLRLYGSARTRPSLLQTAQERGA
jgi:hypothetical protein